MKIYSLSAETKTYTVAPGVELSFGIEISGAQNHDHTSELTSWEGT